MQEESLRKGFIGYELRTLTNAIKSAIDYHVSKELGDENITVMHLWIIGGIVQSHKDGIIQRELEEMFSFRKSTGSKIVQLMEKNGLIERRSVAGDARKKEIYLTEKAMDIHQRVKSVIDSLHDEFAKGITEEELQTFVKVINQIKLNVANLT